ncbi:MAG: glycosyltransferase family 2 protein, partial [Chloroflexi bacterium]|nr:glycosyltransferase family 2 protein [Chloroflexota bacterium]
MTKNTKNLAEVSIIVPCYNEENTIELLLEAIRDQNFKLKNLEVVIADSMSTDLTRERILKFSNQHKDMAVRIVENPKRTIPSGVNTAVENAQGEFIVRMDAHSVPNKEYVQHSIDLLRSGKAQNVGGIWEIQPGASTCIAKAIARSASHPIGAGDATYRTQGRSDYVDTVPFGAFRRDFFLEIGKFNEEMLANEDYEFNTRVRKAGGRIWMDTRIRSQYFARKTLVELAKQYWRYGFWKFKMLRRFPDSVRWRQAIPPLFVLFLILFSGISFVFPIALIILTAVAGLYLFILFL